MKPHVRLKVNADVGLPTARADSGLGGLAGYPLGANQSASLYARNLASWRPLRGSADADNLPELGTLIARSRDLERNNGVAKGAIQTILDNVVGVGLRLSARPNYRALGRDKTWADDWAKQVETLWWSWWESTACDAADMMNGDQLATQIFRAELLAGDGLALPLWLPDRGDGFSTKIQTVESDRLSNPHYQVDSLAMRGGIEFDEFGAPIAYNIRKWHPGDFWISGATALAWQWERIERKTPFGRLRVIHTFDKQRSGQSRGKPLLSSVLGQFKQLDRYAGAELDAAVVNAMLAMFVETPMEQDAIIELFKNDQDAYLNARRDTAVGLQSGSIMPLFPGDKIQSFAPNRPATAFGGFMEVILRIIGASLDLPYELVVKDWSKTNYSSARAALLEAWRSFNRRRDWLSSQLHDPLYGLFLEEVVNDGRIEAPGFYENRAAYQRCRWIGPGRGWVDPMKEAMSSQMRIDGSVSTLEDECAEQGKNWEDVLEQRSKELERMKELNIPQVVAGRATIVPDDASNAPGIDTPGSSPTPTPTRPGGGA